jgi:L-cysteine desulfidase
MFDCAVAACGAGPAATGAAAGLAGMHCGGWERLRLMRGVPRTVRNGARLPCSPLESLQGQPPLECSV